MHSVHSDGAVGVDLGATNLRVGVINKGDLDIPYSVPIHNTETPEDLVDQLLEGLRNVVEPATPSIGIGVPSVVDPDKGIVYDVQNIPSWKEVHLAAIVEAEFKIPVYINNDANCFAWGEYTHGIGVQYPVRSMVGLILGTGFGSGLVLDGHLYSGPHCGAGEVGMLPYKESIFEHYCSGQFFEREAQTSGAEVYERATQGDPKSMDLFQEFGRHVGRGIQAVMYAYDPELIVFGGSAAKALHLYEDILHQTLDSFAYKQQRKDLIIKTTTLQNAGIYGAASLSHSRSK
jgi:glucokinase